MSIHHYIYTILTSALVMAASMAPTQAQQGNDPVMRGPVPQFMPVPTFNPYNMPIHGRYHTPPGHGHPYGYPPASHMNRFGSQRTPWSGNWSSSNLPWRGNRRYRDNGGRAMPWQGWHKDRYPWNRTENYEILPWNWNINNGPWNGWAERYRKFPNRGYDSGSSSVEID